MPIKSLDELKKIRDNSLNKVKLRETGQNTEDTIELMVGLATCGIAAGARETMKAIVDELQKQKVDNVRVVRVGCMGYCHSEPTVQVNVPGEAPVLYGNVDETVGRAIVKEHLVNKKMLKDNVLVQHFDRA